MTRALRTLTLIGILLGCVYLISLLPWIGKVTEDRATRTQMASTAPLQLALPEPRPRAPVRPGVKLTDVPQGVESCNPNRSDPDCVPSEMNRVTDLIEAGKFEEARDLLLGMLKANPGNVHTANTLALLFRHRLDDPQRAEQYFRLALQGNPDRPDIMAGLTELYAETRSVREGLAFFQGLSARNPENGHAKMALGSLELEEGSPERAISYLREAIKFSPDLIPAYDLLADSHLKANRPEQAAATLRRLLRHYIERRKEISEAGEASFPLDTEIKRVRARLAEIVY